MAGAAVPARARLGRRRHELLRLLGERGARRALPVRRARCRGADRAPRAHGVQLALLSAGRRARHPLRVSRPRPVRPTVGEEVQPGEAAHRSLREADRRRSGVGRRERPALHALARRERRPHDRRDGLGAGGAERRHRRSVVRLGGRRRRSAADPVARHGDLRGARQGVHEEARGGAGRPSRHVRRARERGLDRLPEVARRDGGRVAARASHRRRGVPARPRADELLGLLDDRVPRAALAVRGDRRPGARVQGDGEGAASRRASR